MYAGEIARHRARRQSFNHCRCTKTMRLSHNGIRTLAFWGLSLVIGSQYPCAQITFAQERSRNQPVQMTTARTSAVPVEAEGLGASPDEALKDAFRNAVRQVVGAVVDAETIVRTHPE
jgi:hypothetical protein